MGVSYSKIGNLTASQTKRVFKSIEEFGEKAEFATKEAIKDTLEEFKTDLKQFIQHDVYDSYNPTWYKDKRTYSLINDTTLETYIYKNTKNAIGGGIRFNDDYYNAHSERDLFQHGNDVRFLPMTSFLQIMNDSSKLSNKNPYHFPTDIDRGSFWDEFLKYMDENYDEVFQKAFKKHMGIKPSATFSGETSKGMNLSSSTSHLESVNTGKLNFERETKWY